MGLYELKLRIKNLPVLNGMIEKYKKKQWLKADLQKRKALKENGISLVERVESALKNTGVVYFIDFGSLLGVIRDGKFIASDDDVDYGIYIDEDFTWQDLEKCLLVYGLKKVRQFQNGGKVTEQTYEWNGLSVDFFSCENSDNYLHSYVYFRKKGYIYHSCREHHVAKLNLHKISATEELVVNGTMYHIPVEAEVYLASMYTSNWRIPDPAWDQEKSPAWNELNNTIGYVEYFGE